MLLKSVQKFVLRLYRSQGIDRFPYDPGCHWKIFQYIVQKFVAAEFIYLFYFVIIIELTIFSDHKPTSHMIVQESYFLSFREAG